MRACGLLAAALLLGGGAPLPMTAPGTVKGMIALGKNTSGPVPVCLINGAIDPSGASFDTLGPAVALYRRDVAGGTVALTLPGVAHGTLTTSGKVTVAALDYGSIGTASLAFTTATSGSVTFIGGGNTLINPKAAPVFTSYTETWHKGSLQLEVHLFFKMDGCSVPVVGFFQF